MARLLLADRVKQRQDSFLAPLIPALERAYDVRFVSLGPGEALAEAIAWADIVWLEWCWDHAVWVTRSDILRGRPCIVRLHSIEALQTDFPQQMNWSVVNRLVVVGEDIAGLVRTRLRQLDPRYSFHIAGAFSDLRTGRYLQRMIPALGLAGAVEFAGAVADMPGWYADKGVLLSTTMYESFGLNIGEAMAVGAFPVIHHFPGAEQLWPVECLFASIDQAVALIRAGRPGLYRDWVAERYGLDRQESAVLALIGELAPARSVALA